ncbi:MAG: hypothetical protein RLZZ96_1951 [Bacteroidota bacterium]
MPLENGASTYFLRGILFYSLFRDNFSSPRYKTCARVTKKSAPRKCHKRIFSAEHFIFILFQIKLTGLPKIFACNILRSPVRFITIHHPSSASPPPHSASSLLVQEQLWWLHFLYFGYLRPKRLNLRDYRRDKRFSSLR